MIFIRRFTRLFSIMLVLGLAACGDSQQAVTAAKTQRATPTVATKTSAKPLRILETFKIGPGVYARSLAVDSAHDSIWVGTSVGALEVDLKTRQVRHSFTRANSGLANEYVFAVGIDKQGAKWFGTNGGGAARLHDGKWQTYFPMNGLADYWVYAFATQHDGTLWIGTWAGANRFDPKKQKFTTYVKQLINEWVYGLGVDSKDRVWFGTEGGVSMFDGKHWRSWTHTDGLGAPNIGGLPPSKNTGLGTRSRHDLSVAPEGQRTYNPNYVFAIQVAADDSIWAGTWGGGVAHFDGSHWSNYSTRDGLAGDIVYSIAQDSAGVLWFGTDHGVSRFDGKKWRTFNRNGGLIGDDVYALAVAPNGDIWAACKGGVVHIGDDL